MVAISILIIAVSVLLAMLLEAKGVKRPVVYWNIGILTGLLVGFISWIL